MRIALELITENEKLHRTEDIDCSRWDLDSFDVHFIEKGNLDCVFKRCGEQVVVTGLVRLSCRVTCSRCLAETQQSHDRRFHLQYDVASLKEYLDIDKDVREEILLDFPMKVLCSKECKGMCAGCGVNLNKEPCRCKKPSRTPSFDI